MLPIGKLYLFNLTKKTYNPKVFEIIYAMI